MRTTLRMSSWIAYRLYLRNSAFNDAPAYFRSQPLIERLQRGEQLCVSASVPITPHPAAYT